MDRISRFRITVFSFVLILPGILAPAGVSYAEDAAPAATPAKEKAGAKGADRPLYVIPAGKPFKVPGGDAQKGCEAYLKNDFAAAEAAFREALKNNPKDLTLLEGLRAAVVARGDYKESQQLNLQMVAASADSPLCNVFASRAMDAMQFVESRDAVLAAFTRIAPHASPAIALSLKDHIAALYYHVNKAEEARKVLEGLGYVDKWLFVAGPFGRKDKSNTIEQRFAPERALKTLEFSEAGGEKIQVFKDVKTPDRDLNLYLHFPGAKGVFYAFTNLASEAAQDVILGVRADTQYRVYLRGLPVLSEPEEVQFRRTGGELIRVRLAQGANPLLVKLAGTVLLSVRVFGTDYGPAKGVRVKGLSGDELAAHEAVPLRGFLLSEKLTGATADYFLKRYAGEEDKGAAGAAPAGSAKKTRLHTLVESGTLTVPEAAWLDVALERENDLPARAALARTLAASFPDSAGVLDLCAFILSSAGQAMGDSGAREAEEARQLREHALEKVPDSHQHLLALYHFFLERGFVDQAFEKIKACLSAHPDSALAQAEMGAVYQRKQFSAEAEKCFEKAAELDEAYAPRLSACLESEGNRVRARELQQKQIEKGRLDLASQFELAMQRGELERAGKIVDEQEKLYPDREDYWTEARVRWLKEKGDLKEAWRLLKKLYAEQPRYHARKRPTLAALVDLALRLQKDDEARALLQAWLKEHAGDVELRQQLSELENKVLPRWWEPYDIKVAEIDTSRFDNRNYPSANHAWIVDFMVTRILPDLSAESYVHIAQKVLNQQGIHELSELLVRAQRQDMIFVRTLNPDGSSFQPKNVHDFNLAQSASLYKVGAGSVLEHAYVTHTPVDEDDPNFNMGFNFNALDAPRAVSRWVVLIPDEAKSKLDIRKIRPELVDEKILPGPPGCTVYQWTNTQVEGIKQEPLMAPEGDQEVIPLVFIEMRDPPYRFAALLTHREKEELPPEAADEARRIVSPSMLKRQDAAAKFEALVLWVWRSIQVGDDSQTLRDVWYSRLGHAGQMTELAREMCLSVGLKVRSAFLNGAYVPGRTWHTKNARHLWDPRQLANFGSGGEMLVLEQPGEPDRWAGFFGRAPKYSWPFDLNVLPHLNASQAGLLALALGDDGARLKRVWGETVGNLQSAQHIEVALDGSGAGAVKGNLAFFGNAGSQWREALADPRRKDTVREWPVRYAWPKAQIGEVRITGEEHPEAPLAFDYSCTVQGLAAKADNAFFLTPFLKPPPILELRGPPERQNDMLLRDEFAEFDHTLTYVAPEGHAWVEVPDDAFLCSEFGFYFADFNVRGRTLTCTRSYLLPAQRITPEKYGKLLDFLQQVSAAQQRIAYAPLNAEPFGPYKREVLSKGYASNGKP
ncbi:MAG: hypothetical protein ABSE73_17495 [Planctomycetota bacterium]